MLLALFDPVYDSGLILDIFWGTIFPVPCPAGVGPEELRNGRFQPHSGLGIGAFELDEMVMVWHVPLSPFDAVCGPMGLYSGRIIEIRKILPPIRIALDNCGGRFKMYYMPQSVFKPDNVPYPDLVCQFEVPTEEEFAAMDPQYVDRLAKLRIPDFFTAHTLKGKNNNLSGFSDRAKVAFKKSNFWGKSSISGDGSDNEEILSGGGADDGDSDGDDNGDGDSSASDSFPLSAMAARFASTPVTGKRNHNLATSSSSPDSQPAASAALSHSSGGKKRTRKSSGSSAAHLESEEEVFEVERILDIQIKNFRVEYLVKWLGYSKSENSWEPESAVLHCVDEFQKSSIYLDFIARHPAPSGRGRVVFPLLKSSPAPKLAAAAEVAVTTSQPIGSSSIAASSSSRRGRLPPSSARVAASSSSSVASASVSQALSPEQNRPTDSSSLPSTTVASKQAIVPASATVPHVNSSPSSASTSVSHVASVVCGPPVGASSSQSLSSASSRPPTSLKSDSASSKPLAQSSITHFLRSAASSSAVSAVAASSSSSSGAASGLSAFDAHIVKLDIEAQSRMKQRMVDYDASMVQQRQGKTREQLLKYDAPDLVEARARQRQLTEGTNRRDCSRMRGESLSFRKIMAAPDTAEKQAADERILRIFGLTAERGAHLRSHIVPRLADAIHVCTGGMVDYGYVNGLGHLERLNTAAFGHLASSLCEDGVALGLREIAAFSRSAADRHGRFCCVPAGFCESFAGGDNESSGARLTKKNFPYSRGAAHLEDSLLLQFRPPGHFWLAVVNHTDRTISIAEPLRSYSIDNGERLRDLEIASINLWLHSERARFKRPACSDYTGVYIGGLPHQTDGISCGIFTMMFAYFRVCYGRWPSPNDFHGRDHRSMRLCALNWLHDPSSVRPPVSQTSSSSSTASSSVSSSST